MKIEKIEGGKRFILRFNDGSSQTFDTFLAARSRYHELLSAMLPCKIDFVFDDLYHETEIREVEI